jgi:hypothetical protein
MRRILIAMSRRFAGVIGLCVLLWASSTPGLCAQGSVELKLAGRELYVGEAAELVIQVSVFQDCEPPEAPEIPGATLRINQEASESTFTSIVNGRMTASHSRTYRGELTPLVPGELTIPPIAVRVDGAVQHTQPVKVVVKPSDADQFLAVEISVGGRSRIYVGQRVPLTMTIWLKPARYGNQLLDAGDMLRQIRAIDLGPFNPQVSKVTRRVRPGTNPAEQFYAYEFTADYAAERPGQLAFDNVVVGVAYPAARGTRNLRARPNMQSVEVLPVPMAGRPANFAGAVGLFDIKISAEPTNVRVGDPIELTIEIFGEGPVETLPPPLLADNERLAEGFRLPTESLAGETKDARRRFKVTIRAKRDDVKEIPPIEYPYFDPNAERFVVAHSAAIPLSVAASAEVAGPDVTMSQRVGAGDSANLQALDGLRDIETSESVLLASATAITPGLVSGVIGIPVAAFLLTWGAVTYVQARTADPARRRRQTALRTAQKQIARARSLPPGEMAGVITAALAGYLADRTGEPAARFTGTAAEEYLRARAVPPETVAQWAALVGRCEELAYAGGAHAGEDALCEQTVVCLKALERRRL